MNLTGPRSGSSSIRIEIQALRALAVTLVVLYHLWPRRLTGGYVGVDVFFVISGFLITSHLLGEIGRDGGISLPRFWARRARRLLPASFFVLAVVAIATLLVVPDTHWRQYMDEIGASAVYILNWRLAANAVDYLAAENAASPVQHFWSLSAEEQFYLVWPVLLLVADVVVRKRSDRVRRGILFAVMATVTIASFVVSMIWTDARQASAYFVTPTRMWEFSLGGLLVFLPRSVVVARPAVRSALSVAGLVAIGLSSVAFSGGSKFPGYIALLPVLGTAAVIAAGNPRVRWSPTRIMGFRPVQFLGDISYSFYLWHWPLIVLVPIVMGSPLTAPRKLLILAATLALAWATKLLIEDRFRTTRAVTRLRPRWVFATVIGSTLAIVALTSVSLSVLDARNDRDAARVLAATSGSCFGAAALVVTNDCLDPFSDSGAMTPAFARSDMLLTADPGGGWRCETPPYEIAVRTCVVGKLVDPDRTIAMLGDSHSMHFLAALTSIAERRGWQVITFFKSACSGTGESDVVFKGRPDDQEACATWGSSALDAIAADPHIDTVVYSNARGAYSQDDGASAIGPAPYARAWKTLTDAGKKVLVIGDIPRTFGGDVPDCLATNGTDKSMCDASADNALPYDATAVAAADSSNESVRLLDLTAEFCRDDVCHARIGGVIVYADSAHLTTTYAKTLAPYIEAALIGW